MPVTDAYSTAANYRLRFGKSDISQDAAILEDLLAVSRHVDRLCGGRYFTRDGAAVARVVYPRGYYGGSPEAENPWRGVRGARILDLEFDLAALPTSVIIDANRQGNFSGYTALAQPDASGLTGGDYQLWPLNADKGSEPKPWNQLYMPTWSAQAAWPSGCPVQVTAVTGWPAVPAAIARATEQLTAILRLESPRGTARVPEGLDSAFAASPAASQLIAMLVSSYKRERIYA